MVAFWHTYESNEGEKNKWLGKHNGTYLRCENIMSATSISSVYNNDNGNGKTTWTMKCHIYIKPKHALFKHIQNVMNDRKFEFYTKKANVLWSFFILRNLPQFFNRCEKKTSSDFNKLKRTRFPRIYFWACWI